jgi:hypothetical protein
MPRLKNADALADLRNRQMGAAGSKQRYPK